MKYLLVFTLFINVIGVFLGWLFTESRNWALSRILPALNRKPFNCRPCLTFHLLWIMYAVVALVLHSLPFALVGLVLAFVVFTGLHLDSKSKIDD